MTGLESRVFAEVEAGAKKLPLPAMTRQAQLVLEVLRWFASASGLDLRTTPPLRGTEAPDGSFLIEWTFADGRLGFNVEPEPEDSGWYFVSTKLGRASGSLSCRARASSTQGTPESSIDSRFDALRELEQNWDGDGATAPSDLALCAATLILRKLPADLGVSEIDPDAVGGVVLWLTSKSVGRERARAWFECRNSGRVFLVLDDSSSKDPPEVKSVENVAPAFEAVIEFLGKTVDA